MTNAEHARQVAILVLRAGAVRDYRGADMAEALAACAPVVDVKSAAAAGLVMFAASRAAAQAGVAGYGAISAAHASIESLTYGETGERGLARAIAAATAAGIEVA